MIDAGGIQALSMRKLGAHLGVQGMALYYYVSGRDDLLDAVVDMIVDELYDDQELRTRTGQWQEYLYRLAHGVRRVALAHPQVFPLLATRPPAAPWLRPPLRSLRWMESFLQTLQRCGFSDEASVAAYQGFSHFLLGHLLLEVSTRGADVGPVPQPDPGPPRTADLDGYPLLQRLEPLLSRDRAAEEFDDALEELLQRLTVSIG